MITVKITGLNNALIQLDAKKLTANLQSSLTKFGERVELDAKQNCPVDEGLLRASIFYDASTPGTVKVGARANYAAYVEFGTRKFAAAYVATLPPTWQEFAAEFKGPGGGTFEQFVKEITEWVERKGIVATFSVKTRKQLKNAASTSRAKQAAYAIALKILREGIKPQPFLYPAINKNLDLLVKDIETGITK